MQDNNVNTKYKEKNITNEYNVNQNKIENKDFEIKHPKEVIKHLVQENDDLRTILKVIFFNITIRYTIFIN